MNGLSSGAVLAAFAESLVEGRRVVVFGSALSSTPRLLLERGARLVHVCDPAPLRVAEALRRPSVPGLTISTLNDDEVAAREGAVDCVLVEHLGAFDARSVVEKVRKLLAVRGVALFVTPNREARRPLLPASEPTAAPLDYYALYDLVKAEFEVVRMLGQAPFVGYAVVDFAPDGEPEPVVDTDFVPRGSEEPELFVAIAARHRPNVPGHALVQLPLENVFGQAGAVERAVRPERPAPPPELVRKLEQQEAWIRELESRAATADERADLAEEELEALRERLASEDGEASRRAELEARQANADALARNAELAAELERERDETDAARRERDAFATRIRDLEAELDETKGELQATSAELSAKTAELAALGAEAAGEREHELTALEERLTERGQEIRRLERELAEAERIGKDLVAELRLGQAAAQAGAGASGVELDALALRLATAEADREALSWVVAIRAGES
ncbi:MAG TPA: hypothetical protein VF103_08570 [Polyangiaceae bacterium]